MIHTQMLKELTEQETDMLLFIVNVFSPHATEIDLRRLASFKFAMLAKRIKEAQGKLSEEGVEVYNSLCQKLKIPIDVTLQQARPVVAYSGQVNVGPNNL